MCYVCWIRATGMSKILVGTSLFQGRKHWRGRRWGNWPPYFGRSVNTYLNQEGQIIPNTYYYLTPLPKNFQTPPDLCLVGQICPPPLRPTRSEIGKTIIPKIDGDLSPKSPFVPAALWIGSTWPISFFVTTTIFTIAGISKFCPKMMFFSYFYLKNYWKRIEKKFIITFFSFFSR